MARDESYEHLHASSEDSVLPAGWYGPAKRVLDVLLASFAVVVTSPLVLVAACLIRLDSAGPALYRQRRIGRGSAEFTIYKFRTMRLGTVEVVPLDPVTAGQRITRVGRVLRRTSLDELPQFINVLRGEMSLVGPRPALFNQADLIELRRVAGVDRLRPGITGLAQISGRDALDVSEKVAYDVLYMDNCSLAMDLRVMGRTFLALASGRGVN